MDFSLPNWIHRRLVPFHELNENLFQFIADGGGNEESQAVVVRSAIVIRLWSGSR